MKIKMFISDYHLMIFNRTGEVQGTSSKINGRHFIEIEIDPDEFFVTCNHYGWMTAKRKPKAVQFK